MPRNLPLMRREMTSCSTNRNEYYFDNEYTEGMNKQPQKSCFNFLEPRHYLRKYHLNMNMHMNHSSLNIQFIVILPMVAVLSCIWTTPRPSHNTFVYRVTVLLMEKSGINCIYTASLYMYSMLLACILYDIK